MDGDALVDRDALKSVAAIEPDLDDPDNPEWTEEEFARARRGDEVLTPDELCAFPLTLERMQSEGRAPEGLVALRLDPEVIVRFKSCGPDWRERMSAALKSAVERGIEPT